MVRFRTLGCWPLTGAVESNAQTLPEIIEEMLVSTTSERQGRVIDRDQAGSMELKNVRGIFKMNTALAQQIANEGGVEAWMIAQQHKSLLRFLTCGSVDDGKSTLIGRLLHDTRQIYEDQLSSLHNDSKRHGTQGEKLDLALLVDGLQAEREQGITIDVAYRYFSTEKRKFIIADTPGTSSIPAIWRPAPQRVSWRSY